jgi:hypothetical protein
MKKVFLLFLMSSALSALATEPAAATKIFLDAESDGADPKIVVTEWYILPEHLQKLPSYQPAVDSPPLSVKEALGLAQDELKKHLVAQETWSLDSSSCSRSMPATAARFRRNPLWINPRANGSTR